MRSMERWCRGESQAFRTQNWRPPKDFVAIDEGRKEVT